LRFFVVGEVATLTAPVGHGVDDSVSDLLQAGFTLGGALRSPEVLLGKDVGGVDRPGAGHLDVKLLEGNFAGLPVRDASVAFLPRHRVVRMHASGGEVAADSDSGGGEVFWGEGHGCSV